MGSIFLFEQIEAFKLFSNVEEIYEVNFEFWTEYLSKAVENVSTFALIKCYQFAGS